jgi:stage II sporulation protein D
LTDCRGPAISPHAAEAELRSTSLQRAPLIGLLVLALGSPLAAGSFWAAWAAEAADARVRVLLHQGPGPVLVEREGSAEAEKVTRIVPAAGGLRANRGPVQSSWRASGRGIARVLQMRVRGDLEVIPTEAGLAVVNELSVEDYVAGSLAREMSPSWAPAALRAQAVVSRTYALPQRRAKRGEPYHLQADTSSQVYGGVDAESGPVREATAATRGQFLTYRGAPILAVFHSASGGGTASAEEVWGERLAYLMSLPVEGEDDSPDTYWRTAISGTTLGRAAEALGLSVGRVRRVRVLRRSGSGRVLEIELEGPRGAIRVEGRALRGALGESVLRSTLFQVRPEGDDFLFFGSGHGHGVGMSQWGARAMALRGASHREILESFYPGTRLEVWSEVTR